VAFSADRRDSDKKVADAVREEATVREEQEAVGGKGTYFHHPQTPQLKKQKKKKE